MVSKTRKWLFRFRHKKSNARSKVNVITESILEDDESTCVPPSSVADSLDEALNDMDCPEGESNSSTDVVNNIQTTKNVVQENVNEKEQEKKQVPKLDHRVDSKKMCLKLLRKYSRSAMEEQNYLSEEDISTDRSSSDESLTYDDTLLGGSCQDDTLNSCQDDITQPTMTSNESNTTSSSSGIELELGEEDETTITATIASSAKEESPFNIIFGPLLCGLTADAPTPLYNKVRFVCGESNANIMSGSVKSNNNKDDTKFRHLTIKNITIDSNHDPGIPSSFSISEVSSDDNTEIETSFTTDEEDIITVFTCRSIDDKGVTLYSAVSTDEDTNNVYHHTGRYDI